MKQTVLSYIALLLILLPTTAAAEESMLPDGRYAVGAGYGAMYDPADARDFAMVFLSALYDYDDVWPHRAPKQLFFRVEGGIGTSTEGASRLHLTGNFFAVYYLDHWFPNLASSGIKPYVEGGAGLIYRDYAVDGQGLRVNFSPQAGIGMDVSHTDDITAYYSARLHHASNAGLNSDNRGTNGLLFQAGLYF